MNNIYRLMSDSSHAITRAKDALVTLLCLLVAGIFTQCCGALYKYVYAHRKVRIYPA